MVPFRVFNRETKGMMVYRLYVDQDLITERSFVWDKSCQFIRENLILTLDEGVHTIAAMPVDSKSGHFQIKNVTVNNSLVELANDQFVVKQ